MVSICVGVVAHEARTEQATQLAQNVDGHLTLDDGTLGCHGNHRRILDHLSTVGTDYIIVLEDDAQPVDGFLQQANTALDAAPTCHYDDGTSGPAPIVSFYLGTGYPRYWQRGIGKALDKADALNAPWIIGEHLLHAVAYAIRTDLIPDLLDNLAPLPIDNAITEWARPRQHQIAYTYPSLVDHQDGETVIINRTPRRQPRHAHRLGTRDTWRGPATTLEYR